MDLERKAVYTAEEILGGQYRETQDVVPGLITEGLTVFGGDPKAGKSVMSLQLCLDWVNGMDFLGLEIGAGAGSDGSIRKALYLALEDTPRRLKYRIGSSLEVAEFEGGVEAGAAGLSISMQWPSGETGLTMLDAWLAAHPGVRLVVVDTLAVFREGGKGKGGYAGDYRALRGLKRIADRRGVSMVAVTHLTKSKAGGGDPFARITGSAGVTGAADNMMVLVKAGVGKPLAALHARGRDIPERSVEVRLEGSRWVETGEEAEVRRARRGECRKDVLRALDVGGMSVAELAGVSGGWGGERSEEEIRPVVDRLVREGIVVLGADDRYRLA